MKLIQMNKLLNQFEYISKAPNIPESTFLIWFVESTPGGMEEDTLSFPGALFPLALRAYLLFWNQFHICDGYKNNTFLRGNSNSPLSRKKKTLKILKEKKKTLLVWTAQQSSPSAPRIHWRR